MVKLQNKLWIHNFILHSLKMYRGTYNMMAIMISIVVIILHDWIIFWWRKLTINVKTYKWMYK